MSSRAHAESVNTSSVFAAVIQLVVGRPQDFRQRSVSILRLVDLILRMLDAHADGERFALHGEAFAV